MVSTTNLATTQPAANACRVAQHEPGACYYSRFDMHSLKSFLPLYSGLGSRIFRDGRVADGWKRHFTFPTLGPLVTSSFRQIGPGVHSAFARALRHFIATAMPAPLPRLRL